MNAYNKLLKQHALFKKLKDYCEFYELLSYSVYSVSPKYISSVPNPDAYIFSSMAGTLDSVWYVIYNGHINDGFTLLRKYHDFIITNLYLHVYAERYWGQDDTKLEWIDQWIRGSCDLPSFQIMKSYIASHQQLEDLNSILLRDIRYRDIRKQCNHHTHINSFNAALLNDKEIVSNDYPKAMSDMEECLDHLLILHIAYLFYIHDSYLQSSDYEDSIDAEQAPEEKSAYFVAPFVQDFFEAVIRKKRPDVAHVILRKTAMRLT